MPTRTAAWFERQLAHVRECLAEADKVHTDQEMADAEAALAALGASPDPVQTEFALRCTP